MQIIFSMVSISGIQNSKVICKLFDSTRTHTGYCRTCVGTDALHEDYKGKTTMNLGWVTRRSVLHETGHALGLLHEHQNPKGTIDWNEKQVCSI